MTWPGSKVQPPQAISKAGQEATARSNKNKAVKTKKSQHWEDNGAGLTVLRTNTKESQIVPVTNTHTHIND